MAPSMNQPKSTSTPSDFLGVNTSVRQAISQSANAREDSRVTRLRRTLEALLLSARSHPPADATAFNQLLETVLEAVMLAAEAPMGNLQLRDEQTGALVIRVHRGFKTDFLRFFNAVHDGEAACGAAFAKGGPEIVENVAVSPLYSPGARQAMLTAEARAVQSLALVANGRKLGVVSVHYETPGIAGRSREAFAAAAPLIAQVVATGLPD